MIPKIFRNPIVLLISIISIFSTLQLFITQQNPCNKSFLNSIKRQFYHGSVTHILANLYGFVIVTNELVPLIGTEKYTLLIIVLMLLNAAFDYYFFGKDYVKCGIGFSGVLFSLLTWSIITKKGFNVALARDFVLLLLPAVSNPQISFSGHLIGIISGLITYFLFGQSIV